MPEEVWPDLLRRARVNNLLGLLSWTVDDGAILAPPEQVEELNRQASVARAGADRIRAAAVEVSAALGEAGIDHRFYKGIATSAYAYPPGVRHFSDADVLVRRSQFPAALEHFEHLGFRPAGGQADPRTRTQLGVNLYRADAAVDLHHGLVLSPFAERIGDWPFDGAGSPIAVQDEQLPGLTPEACGVVASLELAVHDWPVKPLAARDAIQLATSFPNAPDVARRWGVEGVVAVGLIMAAEVLGRPGAAPPWAHATPLSRRDERLLRAHRSGASLPYLLAALPDLPDLASRRRLIRTHLTIRGHLRERGGLRALARRQWHAATKYRRPAR